LADSIKRAGVLDRDKIRDAMVSTNMMTVIGPIGGFKSDGTAISSIKDSRLGCLYQWQKGKQQIVWPPNLATAPFAYPAKPFKER
jgi:branched-chain amino acid transport system substrate-binding protein